MGTHVRSSIYITCDYIYNYSSKRIVSFQKVDYANANLYREFYQHIRYLVLCKESKYEKGIC